MNPYQPHLQIPANHMAEILFTGDDFIKAYRRAESNTPILYFHAWQALEIQYQGFLTALHADGTGKAQLFEWITGDHSAVIYTTKAFLERCTFYDSDISMRRAYRRAQANKNHPDAWHDDLYQTAPFNP
jgi:hypothetical protein